MLRSVRCGQIWSFILHVSHCLRITSDLLRQLTKKYYLEIGIRKTVNHLNILNIEGIS